MSKSHLAYRIGATVLALTVACETAAAESACAKPEEMTALQVAALRQEFMVAALTCHQAESFNRFILFHQSALQSSDQALARFFARAEDGEDGYNAYKTRLANTSSLRSLSDPQFCGDSAAALAFGANLPLEQVVAYHPIDTGFARCDVAALPAMPAQTAALASAPEPSAAPVASPQTPAQQGSAPPVATVASAQPYERRYDVPPPEPYRPYRVPYPYSYAYYRVAPYAYGPQPPMRQVAGPDGRWYLMPAYGP